MANLRPRKSNVNYCELTQDSQDTSDIEISSGSDDSSSSQTQESEVEEEEYSEIIATTTKSKGKKYNVSSSSEEIEEEEEEVKTIHGDDDDEIEAENCLVCESDEQKVSIRYNVLACDPCAKVFANNLADMDTLECLADPVKCCASAFRLKSSKFKKNYCLKCRLAKCIKVGMRKKVLKLPNGMSCGTFSCDEKNGKCLCCEVVLGLEIYEVEIEGDDGVKFTINLVDKKNKNVTPLLRSRQEPPEPTAATTTTTTTSPLPPKSLPSPLEQATTLARKRNGIEAELKTIDEDTKDLKEKKIKIDTELENLAERKIELIRQKDELSDDIAKILTSPDSVSKSDL